jgi:hypothetical protein
MKKKKGKRSSKFSTPVQREYRTRTKSVMKKKEKKVHNA